MAIKNAFKGGTDWSDGDILYAADLNDTFNAFYTQMYSDTTGGSVSSSTTETTISTVTINQNDLGSNVTLIILVSAYLGISDADSSTSSFKIKIDGTTKDTHALTSDPGSTAPFDMGVLHLIVTGKLK